MGAFTITFAFRIAESSNRACWPATHELKWLEPKWLCGLCSISCKKRHEQSLEHLLKQANASLPGLALPVRTDCCSVAHNVRSERFLEHLLVQMQRIASSLVQMQQMASSLVQL